MEIIDGVKCITYAELTDGVMTEDSIKNLRRRKKLTQIRRACYGTPALYAIDSLPVKYREAVKERYGTDEEQVRSWALINMIVRDDKAAAYYDRPLDGGTKRLPDEAKTILTNSASILNACGMKLTEAAEWQAKVGKRNRVNLGEFWAGIAEILPRVADQWPHNLPSNPRSLWRKYNAYRGDGNERNYGALISGKYNNSNAAAQSTPEQKAWLYKFVSYHTNPDCEEVAQAYNTVADEYGWRKITGRSVWNMATKNGWAVAPGRYGAKEAMNRYGMQVKRFKPTTPLLFWSLDGWNVELYYRKKAGNGKRGGKTLYSNRMTVVVVLDPFNGYPIGYATGYKESPALIKEALRNAANHTRELFGKRYRPVQVQSDNYQIKVMLPLYGQVAKYVTPAQVGNAKAKPIEPYFKRLNHNYAKKCSGNWSGYGITSRKESQPDFDWLNNHKGGIPDEEGVRAQIDWIIAQERALKGAEYMAAFGNIKAENLLPMDNETYLLAFGAETGYKNALEGSGLNVRLLGCRRTYDSFDLEFRKLSYLRWNVRFDPDDMSEVLAVSDDGAYRFLLEEKHLQPMALADRREGDAEELERVKEFNRDYRRAVIEMDARATELVRESLLRHPDYDNPYAKNIITDSRGQHKDNQSDYRLEYTGKVEEAEYEESGYESVATASLY